MKTLSQLAPIDERSMGMTRGGESGHFSDSTIVFAPRVFERIMYYVQAARGEIGGFGRVETVKRRINGVDDRQTVDFHITEAVILKQAASGGYCEIDADAILKFADQRRKAGDDPSAFWLWWHSHSDFSVFMSGTDIATLKNLSRDRAALGVCFNRYGQMHGEYHNGYFSERLLTVVRPLDHKSPLRRQCADEVRRLVRPYVAPVVEYTPRVRVRDDAPWDKWTDYDLYGFGATEKDKRRADKLEPIPAWEREMIAQAEALESAEREARMAVDTLKKHKEGALDDAKTAEDGLFETKRHYKSEALKRVRGVFNWVRGRGFVRRADALENGDRDY